MKSGLFLLFLMVLGWFGAVAAIEQFKVSSAGLIERQAGFSQRSF